VTPDEIVLNMKLIYEKTEYIKTLGKQRIAEEQALCQEYKVDECNSKRSAIATKYSEVINQTYAEIATLQTGIANA
jgi:hypothetical protein